jgi:hypothetical protein
MQVLQHKNIPDAETNKLFLQAMKRKPISQKKKIRTAFNTYISFNCQMPETTYKNLLGLTKLWKLSQAKTVTKLIDQTTADLQGS